TLAEHEAIFNALSTRDPALSQAAALLHVSNTEQGLREHQRSREALTVGTAPLA
ncbi:GntR family transcriptional regulator, partial [Streptomyces sp. NPDC006739]